MVFLLFYFLFGFFTFVAMYMDAEVDSDGYVTPETKYKMFWGCTFWPITWIIGLFILLFAFCQEAIKFPKFIVNAIIWGLKQVNFKKEKKINYVYAKQIW